MPGDGAQVTRLESLGDAAAEQQVEQELEAVAQGVREGVSSEGFL